MTDSAQFPIATLRYTLTWRDGLAYETLARSMSGLQQITFYMWLALAGLILIALPPELMGETNSLRFWITGAALVAVQYAIFVAVRAVMRFNRARFRYPAPVDVVLTQWPDHLVVETAGKTVPLPFEMIGVLLPTPTHLFMAAGRDLVIVPATAFAEPEGLARMVAEIDGFMRDKYAGAGEGTEGEAALPALTAASNHPNSP